MIARIFSLDMASGSDRIGSDRTCGLERSEEERGVVIQLYMHILGLYS